MAGATEEMHIVECYPTAVFTDVADWRVNLPLNLPTYDVTGIMFSRDIYRPIGQPDILLSQHWIDEAMYRAIQPLTVNAMRDTHHLRQAIAAYPPPANVRTIPDRFNGLAWAWENDVATALSDYVHEDYFNHDVPFVVKAYEAFGRVTLFSEANRWREVDWWGNPLVALNIEVCGFCLGDDIDQTPIDRLLALRCRHVFHRNCILTWAWDRRALPDCPICHQLI